MNSRRKQILQELNLLPAWRLKSDASEKNSLSHRANALKVLKEMIGTYYENTRRK